MPLPLSINSTQDYDAQTLHVELLLCLFDHCLLLHYSHVVHWLDVNS